MKWDGKIESFYLLAIVNRRDLKSIRDLNETHISLLETIYNESVNQIKLKYNLDKSKYKIYFHYQPSFYHLHVHITHIHYETSNTNVERAHLLLNVIDNIKLCSDYYQKCRITYKIRKNDSLYKLYEPYINTN